MAQYPTGEPNWSSTNRTASAYFDNTPMFQHEHSYQCGEARSATEMGKLVVVLFCPCGDVKFVPYPEKF